MCFAAVCFKRKLSKEELDNAEKNNDDGAGIAYIRAGVIHIQKGLNAKEIYKISQREQLPQLIHFRLRSAGGYGVQYCHPFVLDLDQKQKYRRALTKKPVLVHNGHVSEFETLYYLVFNKKPKGLSDTQAIAQILAFKKDFNLLNFLSGKFAVLFKDKSYKLFGDWEDDNGVYVSNNSHKKTKILSWGGAQTIFWLPNYEGGDSK